MANAEVSITCNKCSFTYEILIMDSCLTLEGVGGGAQEEGERGGAIPSRGRGRVGSPLP